MIASFQFFIYYILNLMKKRKVNADDFFDITSPLLKHHPLPEGQGRNIRFDPPLSKQRYERALEILTDERWNTGIKKVVDFGCADFSFFLFIRNAIQLDEMFCVDVDSFLLQNALFKVYPLNADYLARRQHKFKVSVYAGSLADPDPCLVNTDAVVGLEIIEHLYPDVLDAVPYNVFGYIKPKLVIFTTPNAEYNVLFENVNIFRHADHKFEWTREQFQLWATNITLRFPAYIVRFCGVGLTPPGHEHLGDCSQAAVFIRQDICDNLISKSTCTKVPSSPVYTPVNSYGICTYYSYSKQFCPKPEIEEEVDYYKLITAIDYPYHVETRTQEEQHIDELIYRINFFSQNDEFYNQEKVRWEIPLDKLAFFGTRNDFTLIGVRSLLSKLNYKIEECSYNGTLADHCIVNKSDMDGETSGNETDASGYESDINKHLPEDDHLSDWDDYKENDTSVDPESKKDTSIKDLDYVKSQLHLEMETDKKQESLVDSGYQKSPCVPDESPRHITPNTTDKSCIDKPNKLSHVLSVFDNFDKINELDTLPRHRRHLNVSSNLPHKEIMKKICQEIAKNPVAGPSREPKKPKSKSHSSESDDSGDEVKSITKCIIENSLNRIDVGALEPVLIQELLPEVVENGDLANNNRDGEGNNYVAVGNLEQEIDNVGNVNQDNNNEVLEENVVADIDHDEENVAIAPVVEVAWSSREALFDVNSQVDLLEDFDLEDSGVNVDASGAEVHEAEALPDQENIFPNWLLQIFEEDRDSAEDELHDEPHFYCQGDGLGVHPSTVNLDDDDDGDDESESSQGEVEFISAENHPSLLELINQVDEEVILPGQALIVQATNIDVSQVEIVDNTESELNLEFYDA